MSCTIMCMYAISLRASLTVSVEFKFPVELNSFSDASYRLALYFEISLSTFEIRTNFSLALEKVGSCTRKSI